MTAKPPIVPPASYVTPLAVGFADSAGDLLLVTGDEPLPVTAARPASPPPLSGSASVSTVAGPYAAIADAPIHLQLEGEWSGTVELQRSIDGGATRQGVTVGGAPWARFAGNANEPVWHEGERGVLFYLAISLVSGTLDYRISQ